jgi:omega-6 fatty acid desaturase (delta-12 desaturase)
MSGPLKSRLTSAILAMSDFDLNSANTSPQTSAHRPEQHKPDQLKPDQGRWSHTLIIYSAPYLWRSVVELAITVAAFLGLWWLAWASFSVSYLLTLLAIVPGAGFLIRLFIIQHDCGHGSFLRNQIVSNWIGRFLGVLTFTPYDLWRRTHAIHHASAGNLDRRGVGDINTLTVREYLALPPFRRLLYRLYRHPLVLFVLAPAYLFFIQQRLPVGLMRGEGWLPWISAMATNLALVAVSAVMIYFMGWRAYLFIEIPMVALAASVGLWLFYVQHQFEHTYWSDSENWTYQEAALRGSSYYDLPAVIHWISGNIGIHHVHHLQSRIPFYRLPETLRDHPPLREISRMTFMESLGCARRTLWDEASRRLVPFKEARAQAAGR